MDVLRQDVRFALRLLWKDRGFAATALVTLALCLGANTLIFSLVNSILFKPLPVPAAHELVLLGNRYPNAGAGAAAGTNSGIPDYFDRRAGMPAFSEQALFRSTGMSMGEGTAPERVRTLVATPTFFALLGIQPAVGRAFRADEGEPGNELRVILSDDIWQRLYARSPAALGRTLRLNGKGYEIVGVMPPGFSFIEPDVRLWVPAAFTPENRADANRHSNSWTHVGRLAPGATLAQAQSQVDAINAVNLERFPEFKTILINAGFHTAAVPLLDHLVAGVKPTLYLLWGGVALVLVIGCVNIANLVLIRSNVRMRELVTRAALGAGFTRLARQLLTESLVLTLGGAALGLGLGVWALRGITLVDLDAIPRGHEIALDGTAIVFTWALAVLVGVFIGGLALMGLGRSNLAAAIHEEGRSGTSGRGTRLVRHALVATQVAFAFVLLVGAGLLLVSFRKVLEVDPGFRPSGVLSATINLPATAYPDDDAIRAAVARLMERVRALPGVEHAGLTNIIPMGGSYDDSVILAEDRRMAPGESLVSPNRIVAGPGYFETMGVSLVRGRFFDERDTAQSQRVAIVDEQLARHFWGENDPIGRALLQPLSAEAIAAPTPENTTRYVVAGVIKSVKLRDLVDAAGLVGAYYFPFDQNVDRTITLALRTSAPPESIVSALRQTVAQLDPDMPVFDVRPMQERLALSLVPRRAPMLLALIFGGLALFLSALGLYGVLAYVVTHRTREIGIRMALGSDTAAIVRLVITEGLRVVTSGLVLGLAGAALLARIIASQLYEVAPLDPLVVGGVLLLFALVSTVACALPARRAARVNPVSALNA